jgi:hypothetical protein
VALNGVDKVPNEAHIDVWMQRTQPYANLTMKGFSEVKKVLAVTMLVLALALSAGLASADEGIKLLEEIQAQSKQESIEKLSKCFVDLLEVTELKTF